MNPVRVAAASLSQTPLAWDANKANILAAIDQARQLNANLLCLPELCITGYGCEDAFLSDNTLDMARRELFEILPHTQRLVVTLGLPVMVDSRRYNMACLVANGKILGLVGKQHLANDGIHYEPRWFRPWPAGRTTHIDLGGVPCPVGDLVFDLGGVRIGFEICQDAWVDDRVGRRLAECEVDILLGPSASHFAFGKSAIRRRLVLDGSRDFHCGYVFANLLGNEAGRAIYDGDTLIAARGELLAAGERLSFADPQITLAVLDIEAIRQGRPTVENTTVENPVAKNAAVENAVQPPASMSPTSIAADFALAAATFDTVDEKPTTDTTVPPAWTASPYDKEEEFTRAVALGLFDYLRKSRSQGFVVSISGGVDSAAVATLVATMVRLAWDELGSDRLLAKLAHIDNLHEAHLQEATTSSELTGRLLTCVYQSTRNSSLTTRDAARQVSRAIGAQFIELDVDELVQGYVARVSDAVGRELNWEQDDLALQNIQARARSPGVWLLANLRSALLLSTSNRSEAAVGYATMDGDTSGGLAPIAGIDKTFLRHWLRWMERSGPTGIGPLRELAAVNAQEPTAELRPPAAGQADEDDLMPYKVLDAIERVAIRDKRAPLAVLREIEPEFPELDRPTLGRWVERFFRLWCRNQWKRERYAPSFHLDDENLDPKTWCRFPILSGGFDRELSELRAELDECCD